MSDYRMLTYKYKLYPYRKNKKLDEILEICRFVYNHTIALHRRYYRLFKKQPHKYAISNHYTKLKKLPKYQCWNDINRDTVDNIVVRIDESYKQFFRKIKKKQKASPPSFRKKESYCSFTLRTSGYKFDWENHSITLSKVGKIYKFFKNRIPEGKIKLITFRKDNCGDYWLTVVFEPYEKQNEVIPRIGESMGYDFGLKKFLTATIESEDVITPLFYKQNMSKLKALDKSLSTKMKGSNNRAKAKLARAKAYRRMVNQRTTFQWTLANEICRKYATICIEDLNIKGMQKRWGRKIGDLSFYEFVQKLEYVATKYGTTIVKVDRFYPSSQICSECGYQNKSTKNLSVREWICPECGTVHDRDRNAAKNILREGLRILDKAS